VGELKDLADHAIWLAMPATPKSHQIKRNITDIKNHKQPRTVEVEPPANSGGMSAL
jgi:hypothetical protein